MRGGERAPSLGESQAKVRRGQKSFDKISFALDRLATAFLAIHHCHHTKHVPAFALHGGDRLARRSARGEYILDDDHGEARRETALDALTGPVLLRLLAHGKRIEQLSPPARRQRERVGDRVGAEGETADRAGSPTPHGHTIEPEPADYGEAIAGHRGEAGVDVKGGPAARREHEIAPL